ncbi:hypothetical protein ACFXG4_37660 [Nocardia sp. NPDC059246]|uniref:hypothetical protein n=1 Tax=unclassified Nocardia TaxID=2637762 RepID=UPI0036B2F29C
MESSLDSMQPSGSAETTAHMTTSPDGRRVPVPQYVQRPIPAAEQLWEVAVWMQGMWSTVAWTLDRGGAGAAAEAYLPQWPLAQIWHHNTLYYEYTVDADGAITLMQANWAGNGWEKGRTQAQYFGGQS